MTNRNKILQAENIRKIAISGVKEIRSEYKNPVTAYIVEYQLSRTTASARKSKQVLVLLHNTSLL